mmetsp:Transcript_42235/g.82893  ORF Transcript_42235/g.82893 Transcript_42235/m.82893 type:complete len:120 (+) Transcript_42235:330-689(+)
MLPRPRPSGVLRGHASQPDAASAQAGRYAGRGAACFPGPQAMGRVLDPVQLKYYLDARVRSTGIERSFGALPGRRVDRGEHLLSSQVLPSIRKEWPLELDVESIGDDDRDSTDPCTIRS